jgi:RNA polymerase sigma-70 factor (ECF subfamily)
MAATSAAVGATGGGAGSDAVDEARLAHAAAAGDGAAFATLYDGYEGRTFNFCRRLLGSRDNAGDATQEAFLAVLRRPPTLEGDELDFSAHLFVAARNAAHDTLGGRRRGSPSEPGDLDVDPEPTAVLTTLQGDVREANGRLPERQREVLALRELEGFSYDEIAEIMGMDRTSVAELISRARIELRDELRGTALASIAASSPDCERARALIAMRQDRELDDAGGRARLVEHLAACENCRSAQEAIQEAGISYRAWLPIPPPAWLSHATAARAAELVGADWSDLATGVGVLEGQGAAAPATAATMTPSQPPDIPVESADEAAGRGRLLAPGLLALILLLGFSTAMAIGTDRAPQRRFDTTGRASFPISVSTATAAPTTAPVRKSKKRATITSGGVVTSGAPTPSSTGDENAGTGTTTTGTPRRGTAPEPSGNSVGGEKNDGTATPPTSTPSTPAPPELPTGPAGGTPSDGGSPAGGGHAAHPDRAADPLARGRSSVAPLIRATGERGESPLHCAAIGR